MKLGYDLTIKQNQKLVMTPELIQAIRILQFNSQEMELFVEEQLLGNPILERKETDGGEQESVGEEAPGDEIPGDREKETSEQRAAEEFDWEEYLRQRDYDDVSYREWAEKKTEGFHFEQVISPEITLSSHLLSQLEEMDLCDSVRLIAEFIIYDLDDNGYLTLPISGIAAVLSMPEEDVERAVTAIQEMEPVGVGARNLVECLWLQLKAMGEDTSEMRQLLQDHLEDVACNRLAIIAKALDVSVKQVQEMVDRIKALEPKPGRQFASGEDTRFLIPDVTVDQYGDQLVVNVCDTTAPRLSVNSYYRKVLSDGHADPSAQQFLTNSLNSAMWLIKSIEQRRQTIYKVVSAVVDYQRDFFNYGAKGLRTLTLKQIADEVGVHESTVSRCVNGKYMQTPRGLFEIRYFFASGVQNSAGSGLSSENIKVRIRDMINGEAHGSPVSDQAIADALDKEGIQISRRTVAKYREEMQIPASSRRRRY